LSHGKDVTGDKFGFRLWSVTEISIHSVRQTKPITDQKNKSNTNFTKYITKIMQARPWFVSPEGLSGVDKSELLRRASRAALLCRARSNMFCAQ